MNTDRLRWLRTKLHRLFRRRQQEAALDAELQFHFDHLVAEYRGDGMAEEQDLMWSDFMPRGSSEGGPPFTRRRGGGAWRVSDLRPWR